MKKPFALILSRDHEDCRALTEAAVSQGCRAVTVGSLAEASALLAQEPPHFLFCDALLANGGGTLRSLAAACGRAGSSIILITPPGIKSGHLKALKPWVHDYLTTPVLREAAAVRMHQVLREKKLELTADKAVHDLQGWLTGMESVINRFDPLSYDRKRANEDLARDVIRRKPGEDGKPAHLMIAVPDGKGSLDGDVFASSPSGVEKIGAEVSVSESAVFLGIKEGSGLAHANYFDKGASFRDFQASFPPALLALTGSISNVAGLFQAGVYVVAFNYARPVSAADTLFLKGLALPGSFLGAVAGTVQEVSDSFLVMARGLALATDSHGDNGAHVSRMNEYAVALAERMSLPGRFVRTISYSAQLHDVGKIYIHPDLLEKPLRLTPHEFDLVKRHPVLGARIIGDSPLLQVARNISLTHHECWDGSGYPAGLSGSAIPIEGAIIKIADVYDALRTMRAYKKSYSHDDACRLIVEGGGDDCHETRPSQFHPEALSAFRSVAEKFEEIYQGGAV